jgi:hypothetical protein
MAAKAGAASRRRDDGASLQQRLRELAALARMHLRRAEQLNQFSNWG